MSRPSWPGSSPMIFVATRVLALRRAATQTPSPSGMQMNPSSPSPSIPITLSLLGTPRFCRSRWPSDFDLQERRLSLPQLPQVIPSRTSTTTASAPPTTVEQPLYQFSPSPPAAAPSRDQPLSSSPIQTRFRPVLAPESSPVSTLLGASSPRFASLPIGTRIEVSAASFQTAHKLGMLISQGTRCSALVVDYGTNHAIGNSFRVRVSFPSAYYHFFTSDSMRSCVCVGIGGPRPRRPI